LSAKSLYSKNIIIIGLLTECVRVRVEDNDTKWSLDQSAAILFAVSLVIVVVAITLVTATTDNIILVLFIEPNNLRLCLFCFFLSIASHAVP
jgi:hypothetical protein